MSPLRATTYRCASFARLIWKESGFRPEAVSGKGAQGIARFMPGTAALRSLADPFDPESAIDASANYLHDLAAQFGNLGIAAAAYNAGEQRGANWLAGKSHLPWETLDYVLFITGLSPDEWQAALSTPVPAARHVRSPVMPPSRRDPPRTSAGASR